MLYVPFFFFPPLPFKKFVHATDGKIAFRRLSHLMLQFLRRGSADYSISWSSLVIFVKKFNCSATCSEVFMKTVFLIRFNLVDNMQYVLVFLHCAHISSKTGAKYKQWSCKLHLNALVFKFKSKQRTTWTNIWPSMTCNKTEIIYTQPKKPTKANASCGIDSIQIVR